MNEHIRRETHPSEEECSDCVEELPQDWEIAFDKIQDSQKYNDYTAKRFCCGGDYCEGDHLGFIKDFIRELLVKEKEKSVGLDYQNGYDAGFEAAEKKWRNY